MESSDNGRKIFPSTACSKGIKRVRETVILMLRTRRPIFGSSKAVVLGSRFCVTKVITEIKAKVVYAAALIKKQRYCLKGVPGDLIDTHF